MSKAQEQYQAAIEAVETASTDEAFHSASNEVQRAFILLCDEFAGGAR